MLLGDKWVPDDVEGEGIFSKDSHKVFIFGRTLGTKHQICWNQRSRNWCLNKLNLGSRKFTENFKLKNCTKCQTEIHSTRMPGQPDRVSSLDHSPLRAFVCLNGWARALCAPVRSRPSPGNQFMPRYEGRHSGWHFASVLTSKVITMKYKYFNGMCIWVFWYIIIIRKGAPGEKGVGAIV